MILVHFNETRAYTTEYLDLIRVRSSYAFFFQADQILWAQKNLKIAYPISSLNLFLVHQLFVVFIASLVNCLFSYLSNHVSLKALHVVFLCVYFFVFYSPLVCLPTNMTPLTVAVKKDSLDITVKKVNKHLSFEVFEIIRQNIRDL